MNRSQFRDIRVCARGTAESARDRLLVGCDTRFYRDAMPSREKESCSPGPTNLQFSLKGSRSSTLLRILYSSPHLSSLLSSLPPFLFTMFKLARGRPIAAALRAATVRSASNAVLSGRTRFSLMSCKLIHALSIDLGVLRLFPSGSAAEAEPVHPRVPVRSSPEAGMSQRVQILRSRKGSVIYIVFWVGLLIIEDSTVSVSPRARLPLPLRRLRRSPSLSVNHPISRLSWPPSLRSPA